MLKENIIIMLGTIIIIHGNIEVLHIADAILSIVYQEIDLTMIIILS